MEMEKLLAARKCLAHNLNKSRSLSNTNLTTTTTTTKPCLLQKLESTFPSLVGELHYHHDRCQMLSSIQKYSQQAMGPASAVLKVYGAVQGLEQSLSTADPSTDLFGYLSLTRRLEEALRLLADNCTLAIRWLDDVVALLDEDLEMDSIYVLNVKRSLRVLEELRAMDVSSRSRVGGGGSLSLAFKKLEIELDRMLKQEEPFAVDSEDDEKRVHAILERFEANGFLHKCFTNYIDTRSSVAKSRLRRSFDLDNYIEMEASDSVQTSIIEEDQIIQWGRDLEIAVKGVIQFEHDLSKRVFYIFFLNEENFGSSAGCSKLFPEIVAQSGFLSLLNFGNKVTETKKDAIKLLKLLHVFAALDRLRLDFNRLFGGKECIEIQNLTRDIIKRVVDGAYQLFKELALQIEIQGYNASPPPLDAGVPPIVSSITDYCILLLSDEYMPLLSQVISIHHIWRNIDRSISQDNLLRDELYKIIERLEINLETFWSRHFEDQTLRYLFLMTNYLYLYEKFRGTELQEGEHWLEGLQKKMLFYADLYLKHSWGNLAAILREEELLLFSPGSVTAKELVKKRLREFNEMFDNLYNYGYMVENGGGSRSPKKYVRYSAASLEAFISSLYRPNPNQVLGPVRLSRSKSAHVMGRIKSAVSSQLRSTPISI